MITSRDINMMRNDIHDIIDDWGTPVDIWKPLPKEQQPGWNSLMHEISGGIQYDKRIGVRMEERDVHQDALDTSVGGDRIEGHKIFCIPDTVDIDDTCLFILASNEKEPWRVKFIKNRTGERLVTIIKMVGDT